MLSELPKISGQKCGTKLLDYVKQVAAICHQKFDIAHRTRSEWPFIPRVEGNFRNGPFKKLILRGSEKARFFVQTDEALLVTTFSTCLCLCEGGSGV